ncbi:MAG TPA: FAD-dependent oxidoreductase [Isosphaeraceae bacterium]|jgi:sulfide:quinone oxidoreductase|nr:FAD-dependent oxidoreductase [Isosphaeraceae bacterium]
MAALPRIVVVGSSFAGYTAALKLARELGVGGPVAEAKVTVISNTDIFTFIPSLIWLPFGLRTREEITFPLRPPLEKAEVDLVVAEATRIDLDARKVITGGGAADYDYLVVGTGPKVDFDAVPGLGPTRDGKPGHTLSICNLDHAEQARRAWDDFLKNPGPVVVGAVQGASCFGAAYEFALNLAHQVKKHGLRDRVPITFLTAEPYLGHFGIGNFGSARKLTEMFFEALGISYRVSTVVDHVEPKRVVLADGERIPFEYAMLIPPFRGVDAVAKSPGLGDAAGFVEVEDTYRHREHPRVFAAGVAVAVPPPAPTPVPCGVPKTGYLTEEMAKVAAHNIAAAILGGTEVHLPFASIDAKCILDAGNTGVIMTADHILEPRGHAWLIPGPEAHWAKLAFETYFLATHKHGYI